MGHDHIRSLLARCVTEALWPGHAAGAMCYEAQAQLKVLREAYHIELRERFNRSMRAGRRLLADEMRIAVGAAWAPVR